MFESDRSISSVVTNITMSCVDCDTRYRVQPRYGVTPAKMDEMRVEEEEEEEFLVALERC